jgi:thiamine biosynthesis lipoprotein
VTASDSFPALGTTALVAVACETDLAGARELLTGELDALDLACSRFRDDSELSFLNAHSGERVQVSPLLMTAIRAALDAAQATDGLVDPTLGAHLRAAGYDRTFALVRNRDRWTIEVRTRPDGAWRHVSLDTERREVCVPPGVELDLGATAKALAADRAAAAISAETNDGVLVSLGGDIATAGTGPSGGWGVRIADDHRVPLDTPGPLVALETGGLATSSTSVRRWRTDSGEAHHLLDPRTGLPASTPWRTVSVAAATCLDANVASTAALVVGPEAPGWLEARGLSARLVANDGEVVHVGGWPAEAEAA